MEIFDAINIAEGGEASASDARKIEAWQTLIDTGWAWSLGAWFKKQAQALIDLSICSPPPPKVEK